MMVPAAARALGTRRSGFECELLRNFRVSQSSIPDREADLSPPPMHPALPERIRFGPTRRLR